MSIKPLRPVKYYKYNESTRKDGEWIKPKTPKTLLGYGEFHQWGLDCIENETSIGNFSVGIVELPNGQIISVEAELIEFTDKDDTPIVNLEFK